MITSCYKKLPVCKGDSLARPPHRIEGFPGGYMLVIGREVDDRGEVQPLYTIVLGAPGLSRTRTRIPGVFAHKDLERIEKIVREERGFQGFSIAKLTGFWMGRPE